MTPASYAAITAHQGITDHQGSVMGDPHRRSTLNLPTNHFSRIIDGEAVACGEDASRCSSVLVVGVGWFQALQLEQGIAVAG
jgi:hypothetical protein